MEGMPEGVCAETLLPATDAPLIRVLSTEVRAIPLDRLANSFWMRKVIPGRRVIQRESDPVLPALLHECREKLRKLCHLPGILRETRAVDAERE